MSASRGTAAAALLSLALAAPALGAGSPQWAQPFLGLPSPAGPYIAARDEWVIVYGEVEFARTAAGRIERRHRYLLENRTDQPRPFSTSIPFDQSHQELSGLALNVQRALLWHEVNLEKSAAEASVDGTEKRVWMGVEKIPGHHRVVLEYTLTNKFDFPPAAALFPFREFPTACLRVSLAGGASEAGLALSLVMPGSAPVPPTFRQEGPAAWEFREVPASGRLKDDLPFQPELGGLYPFVLVEPRGEPATSWAGFAARYRKEWEGRVASIDRAALAARAEALTRGLQGAEEKARRLFQFVQHEVQYDDSNSRGLDAWVPLGTADTLRSMRADCKGKVLLLQALLRCVGIEASPVLTARTTRYYEWGDTPGGALINHVVLAADFPQTAGPRGGTLRGGPCDGWLLLDPTLEETGFGAPDPGLEGCPALFVGGGGDPRFTIRTATPSAVRTELSLNLRVREAGDGEWKVEVRSNGGSGLLWRVAVAGEARERERVLMDTLSPLLRRPAIAGLLLTRGFEVPGAGTRAEWACLAPDALEVVGARTFLTSPLSLGALFAGIPNGLPVLRTLSPEDRVELAAPWDRRLCTVPAASVTEFDLTVKIPAGWRWTPPPARDEARPWFTYTERWEALGDGLFHGRVRLEVSRGQWPPSERQALLQDMDRLYRGFYSPWVLSRETVPSAP